jgi:hypothetical protein
MRTSDRVTRRGSFWPIQSATSSASWLRDDPDPALSAVEAFWDCGHRGIGWRRIAHRVPQHVTSDDGQEHAIDERMSTGGPDRQAINTDS